MQTRVNMRVFVIDDDTSVAESVALVLRRAGFQVTTFYDPLLAMQHAIESAPDAVVTDFSMPRLNGIELTAWLHRSSLAKPQRSWKKLPTS